MLNFDVFTAGEGTNLTIRLACGMNFGGLYDERGPRPFVRHKSRNARPLSRDGSVKSPVSLTTYVTGGDRVVTLMTTTATNFC